MSNSTTHASSGHSFTKEEQSKGGQSSGKNTNDKSDSKGHSFTKEEQSKGGKNSHK